MAENRCAYRFLAISLIWGSLVSGLFAQENKQIQSLYDFSGGVNNKFSSINIADNESQDAINVTFDHGTIAKRGGYVKKNTTSIPGQDINGVFEFYKSNGNSYIVIFSSNSGYYSLDNGITFTQFMSTLTANVDVNCSQLTDKLYCVNGANPGFYFDGLTSHSVPGMPIARYIRTYQNRLWIAGDPANLSRVYFSAVNDGTSWDTVFSFLDFDPDNGDRITGIGEPLFDVIPVYKTYSTYAVQGNSADSYTPTLINSTIGALHHRSARNFLLKNQTVQIFDSLGQYGSRQGLYYFNGIVVQYLSEKVEGYINGITNFQAIEKFKNWATTNDWLSGNNYLTSAGISQNQVVPSTWGHIDASADDWNNGTFLNVSTNTVDGSLRLFYTSSTYVFADFSDPYHTFSNPPWTKLYGVWTEDYYNAEIDGQSPGALLNTTFPWGSGIVEYDQYNAGRLDVYATTLSGASNYLEIDISSFSTVVIASQTVNSFYVCNSTIPPPSLAVSHYKVMFQPSITGGTIEFDTSYGIHTSVPITIPNYPGNATTGSFQLWKQSGLGSYPWWDNITVSSAAGTFTSPIFDTTVSTPIGGPFTFDNSVPVTSTIAYSVRGATASVNMSVAPWLLVSTTTSGVYRIPLDGKEFWQYKADFSTQYSTQTPVLNSVGLNAATTGYWETPDTFLSNSLSSWGLFSAVEQSTAAYWTYFIKSTDTQADLASTPYVAQPNLHTVVVSTNPWIKVKAVDSLTSSTDTVALNGITVYYNEGSSAKGSVACVYNNRYYWFAQSSTETYNNVALLMDYSGAFSELTDMDTRSCTIYNNQMITGGANDTNIYVQDQGYNDNGAPYTTSWTSKSLVLTNEEIDKTVENVFVTLRKNSAPLTVSLNGDDGNIYSWIMNTTAVSNQNYVTKKLDVTPAYGNHPSSYVNVQLGETSTLPWEVMSMKLWWMPQYVR
jgi:hypothetical protein